MEFAESEQAQLGRYRVERTLGTGGMGVVYLARDTKLQRQVAIKKLRKDATSTSAHLRIQNEARLLAQLSHPNIVQLYDLFEEDGDIALVMEYVEGAHLKEWMLEHPLSLREKLGLLIQICSGLAQAHALGIIHRDLKPDNILIAEGGIAKIADFGIAKSLCPDGGDLTREGHVAGSIGSMSPEQLQGKSPDPRSDLFSLGTLAYQLLCEHNPFGEGKSPFETAERIVRKAHPPATHFRPDLPKELCRLLDRLLEKAPHKRPDSAAAVASELNAVLRRLPPETAGASSGTASSSAPLNSTTSDTTTDHTATITVESLYRRRNAGWCRGRLIAAAGLLLAVAAGTLLLFGQQRAKQDRYIAVVAPTDELESAEQRMLRNNLLNTVRQDLASRQGLLLVPFAESQGVVEQPLEQQARALRAQLLLKPTITCDPRGCRATLELLETRDLSLLSSRSTDLALEGSLENRTRVQQLLQKLLPDNPLDKPFTPLHISEGDYQRYLELFERQKDRRAISQTLVELAALRERAPEYLPIYQLYGDVATEHYFDTWDPQVLERLDNLLQQAPANLAGAPELQVSRFLLNIQRTRMDEARRILDELNTTLPDRASYYRYEANYFHVLGKYEKALDAIDRALALRPSSIYLQQRALSLLSLGQIAAAKVPLREILSRDTDKVDARSLLAAIELDDGNPQETIRLLSSAGDDQLGGLDIFNLCLANYIERHHQPAFECFERYIALAPKDPEPLLYQAQIADLLEQPQRAQQLARKALALADNRDDWEGRLMYARAHAALGNIGEAIQALLDIRQRAPDNLYVNYARSQVYITSDDLTSAKAHIRKTLEQGQSIIWFQTPQFEKICKLDSFADLRAEYPTLCHDRQVVKITQK